MYQRANRPNLMKDWLASWRRIGALTRKETRQILRDPSSIAIGIVFPLILILLFGYGLSLDVTKVSVAVLDDDRSADSVALIGEFRMAPDFVVTPVGSLAAATTLVLNRRVDGLLLRCASIVQSLRRRRTQVVA